MICNEKVTLLIIIWLTLALVGTWWWIYLDRKERKEIENGKDKRMYPAE